MSPIRPENVGHYPTDWPAISWVIRWIRALGRCECRGQCGVTHVAPYGRCVARNNTASVVTGARIVLTVAHLDHVPQHCHPANLRAMCQSCHLRYDSDHHTETRRRTRRNQKALHR